MNQLIVRRDNLTGTTFLTNMENDIVETFIVETDIKQWWVILDWTYMRNQRENPIM